jgi:membrane-bound ClpP family serine protease
VTLPPRRPDGWLRAALATLGFGLLVPSGIADHGGVLPLLVIGIAATAIGFFYLLFPQGMHFAFGASAGLAVYACLFVVIGRAAFPEAPALACNTFTHRRASRLRLRVGSWERVAVTRLGVALRA